MVSIVCLKLEKSCFGIIGKHMGKHQQRRPVLISKVVVLQHKALSQKGLYAGHILRYSEIFLNEDFAEHQ